MVKSSDCQCQSRFSSGFDPSILRHSGLGEGGRCSSVDNLHKKKKRKKELFGICLFTWSLFIQISVTVSEPCGTEPNSLFVRANYEFESDSEPNPCLLRRVKANLWLFAVLGKVNFVWFRAL